MSLTHDWMDPGRHLLIFIVQPTQAQLPTRKALRCCDPDLTEEDG